MKNLFVKKIDISKPDTLYINPNSAHSRYLGTLILLKALRFDLDILDNKLLEALSGAVADYKDLR